MNLYFDIGANKGDYTEYLFSIGADKVICVEANKNLAENLKQRFYNRNIVVINKAVSNVKENIDFYICPECNGVSTCDEQWRTNSRFSQPTRTWIKTSVETISIDNLIEQYGVPEHIKIDVEGYEYNAILGMSKNYTAIKFEWAEEKYIDILKILKYANSLGYLYFGFTNTDTFDIHPEYFYDYKDFKIVLENMIVPERMDLWGMIYCINDVNSNIN